MVLPLPLNYRIKVDVPAATKSERCVYEAAALHGRGAGLGPAAGWSGAAAAPRTASPSPRNGARTRLLLLSRGPKIRNMYVE